MNHIRRDGSIIWCLFNIPGIVLGALHTLCHLIFIDSLEQPHKGIFTFIFTDEKMEAQKVYVTYQRYHSQQFEGPGLKPR